MSNVNALNLIYHHKTPLASFDTLDPSVRMMAAYNHDLLHGKEYQMVGSSETLGGNAGSVEVDGVKYAVFSVNGLADRRSGRFLQFDNYQEGPAHTVPITIRTGISYRPYPHELPLDIAIAEYEPVAPQAMDAMLGSLALHAEDCNR